MKNIKNLAFILTMFKLSTLNMHAGENDPPLPSNTPPPLGLPIGDNIIILLTVAVLLGVYIINNHNLKIKTPT